MGTVLCHRKSKGRKEVDRAGPPPRHEDLGACPNLSLAQNDSLQGGGGALKDGSRMETSGSSLFRSPVC